MLQKFFIFLLIMNNLLFNLINHPLLLSLMLFFKTFLLCLLMGLISQSYWFSYILFLVFIGGILILFIYMISLVSNEKFDLIKNFNYYFFFYFLLFMFFLYMIKMNYFNFEVENLYNMNLLINFNLNKLYNFPNNLINIMLINYLFFLLIVVIKITNLFIGPLRIK